MNITCTSVRSFTLSSGVHLCSVQIPMDKGRTHRITIDEKQLIDIDVVDVRIVKESGDGHTALVQIENHKHIINEFWIGLKP